MKNQEIAVLGAGNGAHTMAADFVLRGYHVKLWEDEAYFDRIRTLADTKTIFASGLISGEARLDLVTSDLRKAIEGVKYICVVTPSFAHESIAKRLRGIVTEDQVIVLYPGAFSSLVFKQILGDECPVVAETNNLPYDTRLKGPARVYCSGRNPINVAFLPADAGPDLLEEMRALHPYERVYEDVLECGLSVVNPALHSGACLLNVGMIEQSSRGGYHMYEHFTPASAKVDLALDLERKAIGRRFGYDLRPIEDFAGKPAGYQWTWQDLYMQMHGDISLTQISGPTDIFNRYLTEDCPFGLVPWSSLGDAVGVETPIMDGITNLYCLIHERDWWSEGRDLEKLGLCGMNIEEIKCFVKTGEK